MTKKRLLNTLRICGALSLGIGMACIFMFKSIGSTIDENGVLHEPFPLLPIGWLFIFGGGLLALCVWNCPNRPWVNASSERFRWITNW